MPVTLKYQLPGSIISHQPTSGAKLSDTTILKFLEADLTVAQVNGKQKTLHYCNPRHYNVYKGSKGDLNLQTVITVKQRTMTAHM